MRKQASKLRFLRRIKADGTSVELSDQENKKLQESDKWYKLTRLSISSGTYVASDFATYVVKLVDPHPVEKIQDCWDDVNTVLEKHGAKLYVDESRHPDKKVRISI